MDNKDGFDNRYTALSSGVPRTPRRPAPGFGKQAINNLPAEVVFGVVGLRQAKAAIQEYGCVCVCARTGPFPRMARTILGMLAVLLLPLLGAVLNRFRGGWCEWLSCYNFGPSGGNALTHDGWLRFAFAMPTGVLIALATAPRESRRAGGFPWSSIVLGAAVSLLTFFGLFVGWGAYFSMGRNPDEAAAREGVFDWLLGRAQAGDEFQTRFHRDAAGMALRGYIATLPSGLLLKWMGYGWLPAMSGALMSLAYEGGFALGLPFIADSSGETVARDGTSWGELLWGFIVWQTLLVAVWSNGRGGEMRAGALCATAPWGHPGCFGCARWRLHRAARVAINVFIGLVEAVLVFSCIVYAGSPTSDERNKQQTLMGLYISSCASLVFHALILATYRPNSQFQYHESGRATPQLTELFTQPLPEGITYDQVNRGTCRFDEPRSGQWRCSGDVFVARALVVLYALATVGWTAFSLMCLFSRVPKATGK